MRGSKSGDRKGEREKTLSENRMCQNGVRYNKRNERGKDKDKILKYHNCEKEKKMIQSEEAHKS